MELIEVVYKLSVAKEGLLVYFITFRSLVVDHVDIIDASPPVFISFVLLHYFLSEPWLFFLLEVFQILPIKSFVVDLVLQIDGLILVEFYKVLLFRSRRALFHNYVAQLSELLEFQLALDR